MIIHCPACNERISSKYKSCPHCRAEIGDSGEGHDVEEVSARVAMERRHRSQGLSYLGMLALVIGAIWGWFDSDGFQLRPSTGPVVLMAGGTVWYMAMRVYMTYTKMRNR